MDLPTVIVIAVALSLDALAVSITCGVAVRRLRIEHALRVASVFGAFHAAMPALGWLAGAALRDAISGIDHWIAFGLLTGIGIKMIYESLKMEGVCSLDNPLTPSVLLVLGVATSMDALAVGVTFAFLDVGIVLPALIIGVVIFVITFVGVYIGKAVGHLFAEKVEIAGGVILIGLGLRILAEHLF